MKLPPTSPSFKRLALLAAMAAILSSSLSGLAPALAQIAGGSTTVDAHITESTQLAMGWSVKKTLMGKTIFNEAGEKVGKVQDLIIAPDKNVSYIIVGAGGFVGIGRHDVAIPVSRIQDKSGKLVMAGGSKDLIKSLPEFNYATDNSKRDAFVAAADQDIAKGKATVSSLEKKAGAATAEAKIKIDQDIVAVQVELKTTESKLTEMKQANAVRWREFEVEVSAATARLRKSIDKAMG